MADNKRVFLARPYASAVNACVCLSVCYMPELYRNG